MMRINLTELSFLYESWKTKNVHQKLKTGRGRIRINSLDNRFKIIIFIY